MAKKKPFAMGMGAPVAPAGPLKSPPGLKMPTQLKPRHVPSTVGKGPTAPHAMKPVFRSETPMDKSALKPPKVPSVKKAPAPKRPRLPAAY